MELLNRGNWKVEDRENIKHTSQTWLGETNIAAARAVKLPGIGKIGEISEI